MHSDHVAPRCVFAWGVGLLSHKAAAGAQRFGVGEFAGHAAGLQIACVERKALRHQRVQLRKRRRG